MKTQYAWFTACLIILIMLSACANATVAPTSTSSVTPTPSNTPPPTETPVPTPTPLPEGFQDRVLQSYRALIMIHQEAELLDQTVIKVREGKVSESEIRCTLITIAGLSTRVDEALSKVEPTRPLTQTWESAVAIHEEVVDTSKRWLRTEVTSLPDAVEQESFLVKVEAVVNDAEKVLLDTYGFSDEELQRERQSVAEEVTAALRPQEVPPRLQSVIGEDEDKEMTLGEWTLAWRAFREHRVVQAQTEAGEEMAIQWGIPEGTRLEHPTLYWQSHRNPNQLYAWGRDLLFLGEILDGLVVRRIPNDERIRRFRDELPYVYNQAGKLTLGMGTVPDEYDADNIFVVRVIERVTLDLESYLLDIDQLDLDDRNLYQQPENWVFEALRVQTRDVTGELIEMVVLVSPQGALDLKLAALLSPTGGKTIPSRELLERIQPGTALIIYAVMPTVPMGAYLELHGFESEAVINRDPVRISAPVGLDALFERAIEQAIGYPATPVEDTLYKIVFDLDALQQDYPYIIGPLNAMVLF